MLRIEAIRDGIVIDHIQCGMAMQIYQLTGLDKLDCCVAIIRRARSEKYGSKDIIKIESVIDLDLDVLGYLDPNITVDVIRGGEIVEKKKLEAPKKLVNVIQCSNPRCITSVEEEIDHIFELTETGTYRCLYCEQEPKKSDSKRL